MNHILRIVLKGRARKDAAFLFLYLVFLTELAFAQNPPISVEPPKTVQVGVGLLLNTQSVYRGAVLWPGPSYFPAVSLTFWEKLRLTRGLQWTEKSGPWSYHFALDFFDDPPPRLRFGGSDKKTFRNQREPTWITHVSLQRTFWNRWRWTTEFHKDINEHWGHYGYASIMAPVVPLVSAGLGGGIADRATNHYVYGGKARGGATHWDGVIQLIIPFLPWGGFLLNRYTYSEIALAEHKDTNFVSSNDHAHALFMLANWNL